MNKFLISMMVALTGMTLSADAAPYTNSAVPKLIVQAADGSVLLHGSNSVIHGTSVRYEAPTNKLTIGYWTKVSDWVSWDFEVTKPGMFSVEILQGCGKGSGGADVDFIVAPAAGGAEQKLSFVVQDTGHFQNFIPRDIGKVKLEAAGKYVLSVKPQKKPGVAVMDLRQVTLKPVGN